MDRRTSYSSTVTTTSDVVDDGSGIRFIEIIFLPFHPVFRFVVTVIAILKVYLGPLQATFNFIHCSKDQHPILRYFVDFYQYIGDLIYVLDTVLRIIHRQVEEEARKREHRPKPAYLILLDLLSVIPIYSMLTPLCPTIRLWPNVLAFNEFLPIYRVVDYFALKSTHSLPQLIAGYSIICFLVINALTCLFLMFTFGGLCQKCNYRLYDWRSPFFIRYPDFGESNYLQYLHGFQYMYGYMMQHVPDYLQPKTIKNLQFTAIIMVLSYYLVQFVLKPKFFVESVLILRHIYSFNSRAVKLILETERRNPSSHQRVEQYYSVVWDTWRGVTVMPDIIKSMPRHITLSIKQNLTWAVFYHSPTFRKTSEPYKRWICENIDLKYKLAGERFFTGAHCFTNLYYIKSGIVQIFSSDDAKSPLLSVTSGTLFGDISSIVPPTKRMVIVRCLTDCEVFVLRRAVVLLSLHKFPEDRRKIMESIKNRMKHARDLFALKEKSKGLDLVGDEVIRWIKKQWWLIKNTVTENKKSNEKNKLFSLSTEDENHCSKYLGQLVLHSEHDFHHNSMFVRDYFPLVIGDHSQFFAIWTQIINTITWIALILLPPNIVRSFDQEPQWFTFLLKCIDLFYAVDVLILLMTAVNKKGQSKKTLSSIAVYRFTDIHFILDLLSTSCTDVIVNLVGSTEVSNHFKFNRLLKAHNLFIDRHFIKWTRHNAPRFKTLKHIFQYQFLSKYVFAYFLFVLILLVPKLTYNYYFYYHCQHNRSKNCTFQGQGILSLLAAYYYTTFYNVGNTSLIKKATDCIFEMVLGAMVFILTIYSLSYNLGSLFYKYSNKIKYQHVAHRITEHYKKINIHPDLMKRMQRYLSCHWKYFNGADIVKKNHIKNETFIIYSKCHEEVAEKIIGKAKLFQGANPALVRDLASKAKFLLLPQKAVSLGFGIQMYRANFLVKGVLKCEYQNEADETVESYEYSGEILSILSLLYGGASLKTYTAASDCEILYIPCQDFLDTFKRYPDEAYYLERTLKEFQDEFEGVVEREAFAYAKYQKISQEKIRPSRHSSISASLASLRFHKSCWKDNWFIHQLKQYRTNPESNVIKVVMVIRMLGAITFILYATLRSTGMIASNDHIRIFIYVTQVQHIVFCLFKPYYSEDGKIISAILKCTRHYMSRSFLIDLCCLIPTYGILRQILGSGREAYIFTHVANEALHLYHIFGWIDYIFGKHLSNLAYGGVLKWQVLIILVMLMSADSLFRLCVDVDNKEASISKSCWLPAYVEVGYFPNMTERTLIFLQGISMTQSYFMQVPSTLWDQKPDTIVQQVVIFIIAGFVFWWASSECLALLMHNYRSNSDFHSGVQQLKKFLNSERVPKELIDKSVAYFQNVWLRTSGFDIWQSMINHIGIVFRQDLHYFFYQGALNGCSSLLGGDNLFARKLATHVSQVHYLPNQEIIRELNLTPNIYIVNRGKVAITKEGKKLATLTKGSIFGQMDARTLRPINVSATALEYTDMLQIPLKYFQSVLDTRMRTSVKQIPKIKEDFLAIKEAVYEDPHDSIVYLLRKKRTIKLPKMNYPVQYDSNKWYFRWLFLSWFIVPVITYVATLMTGVIREDDLKLGVYYAPIDRTLLYALLVVLDLFFSAYIVSEFFTMRLVVVNEKCVYRYKRLEYRKIIRLVIDIASLILPCVGYFNDHWYFHLARCARIYLLLQLRKYFCKNNEVRYLLASLRCVIMIITLHTLACIWIYTICRTGRPPEFNIPKEIMDTFDPEYHNLNNLRQGCTRISPSYENENTTMMRGYITLRDWKHDYLVSILFVLTMFTRTNQDIIGQCKILATLTKIFITMVACYLDLYIFSFALSSFYEKVKETNRYDYKVANLLKYLEHHGLSKQLIDIIRTYATHLWQRQKGCWLPEITKTAPQCLQEDIMVSLYIHHLDSPTLFEHLPPYFKRQLATRLSRTVIYPGKCIVREGDIYPCLFFIHEGEVERWYTDTFSLESRLSSVLTINSYFGIIPGLFPNTPYQFAYYARTVCDLVYLNFDDWQDLLDGYPIVKYDLYCAAIKFRETFMENVK